MQTVKPVDPETAGGKTKDLFGAIEKRVGRVPNMIRTMGHSPAVLEAYLHWNEAFEQTKTTTALRSLISAAVSSANGCDYTLPTAFAFGRKEGLNEDQLAKAAEGQADDPKTAAALRFALNLVRKRGSVSRPEVKELQDAGWGDQEVVEIVALVVLNIFRNYFNLVAGTELDFPATKGGKSA
jgi:uncharacterized peroxidase-related enzyme